MYLEKLVEKEERACNQYSSLFQTSLFPFAETVLMKHSKPPRFDMSVFESVVMRYLERIQFNLSICEILDLTFVHQFSTLSFLFPEVLAKHSKPPR